MGLQDSEKLLVEKISAAANRFCAEEPDKQY
jgi:transcription initiation factor TFIID subunit 1